MRSAQQISDPPFTDLDRVGRVERADAVDLAYDQNASDDVVDALDVIGSRVFNSVADTHAFLLGQQAVAE